MIFVNIYGGVFLYGEVLIFLILRELFFSIKSLKE